MHTYSPGISLTDQASIQSTQCPLSHKASSSYERGGARGGILYHGKNLLKLYLHFAFPGYMIAATPPLTRITKNYMIRKNVGAPAHVHHHGTRLQKPNNM
jgi:hypothetical protein